MSKPPSLLDMDICPVPPGSGSGAQARVSSSPMSSAPSLLARGVGWRRGPSRRAPGRRGLARAPPPAAGVGCVPLAGCCAGRPRLQLPPPRTPLPAADRVRARAAAWSGWPRCVRQGRRPRRCGGRRRPRPGSPRAARRTPLRARMRPAPPALEMLTVAPLASPVTWGVLAQQDQGEAAAVLDLFEDLRPHVADVSDRQVRGVAAGASGRRGRPCGFA